VIVVMVWVRVDPSEAPMRQDDLSRGARVQAIVNAWPALVLFGIIIGGIYGGIFTITEAAAVSAVTASAIGFILRRLTWADFVDSALQAAYQTATILLIAFTAKMFVSFVALTGIIPWCLEFVQALSLPEWQLLLMVCILYLLLGMFLDPLGILVLTLPLTVPLAQSMDWNLVWFGVVVVKLLEIGLITPPVGLNAFVIKSVLGSEVEVRSIFAGIMRFLSVDLIVLLLIVAFPMLSLIIPMSMR
jgi:tripartite ATP-independent transporter DctM subunit